MDSTLLEKTFSVWKMQYEYNQTDFYKYLFLPTKRLYKFNKILVKSVCKNKGNLEGEKRRFNFLLCAQMLFYRNTILHLLTIKRTICIFFLLFCVPFLPQLVMGRYANLVVFVVQFLCTNYHSIILKRKENVEFFLVCPSMI